MVRRLALVMMSVLACSCGSPTSPATTLLGLDVAVRDNATGALAPAHTAPTFFWNGPPAQPPSLQMFATAVYEDGHKEDVTSQVTWQIVNPSPSTISSTGTVTVAGFGGLEIAATYRGQVGYDGVSVSPCGDFCAE